MKKKWLLTVMIVLFAAFFVTACGKNDNQTDKAEQTTDGANSNTGSENDKGAETSTADEDSTTEEMTTEQENTSEQESSTEEEKEIVLDESKLCLYGQPCPSICVSLQILLPRY